MQLAVNALFFLLATMPVPADELADGVGAPPSAQVAVEVGQPGAEAFQRGTELYKAEKFAEAIPLLEEAARAGYQGSNPYLLLREALEAEHGVEGAVALLEEKVRQDPEDPLVRNNLACFYMRQRRWKEAQQMLISALKLDPEEVDARFNLAFLQAQLGQNNGAIEHYEGILDRYPNHVRALSEMCFLLSERMGEPTEAEPYCERAATAAGDDASIQMNLGLVRMRMGDLEGAREVFTRLSKSSEGTYAHTAATYLGYVALQRGELDEAQSRFEHVLEVAPAEDTGEALVGLARVHQADKEYGQAARYYRKAYAMTGSGMLLGAMIKVYLQRYFFLVIGVLLAALALLLWRYLTAKPPAPPLKPQTSEG